jgi:hypothetical protein
MEKEVFFEILQNSDKTEGRGKMTSTGIVFENEEDAIDFVTSDRYGKFAVMGHVDRKRAHAHYNYKQIDLYIYTSIGDYDENSERLELEKKKSNALAKLTQEDIEVLKELGI